MPKLAEAYVDIIGRDMKLKSALNKAQADVSHATGNMQSKLNAFAMHMGRVGLHLLAVTAAAVSAAAVAGSIAALKLAGDWEQAEIAFTTMLGSAQAAKKFLVELEAFAAKTPFELPGLIDSSRRLLAFGFAAQDVIPMLTAIGDAVAGLGGGSAMIDSVTRAIGQMRAKGKANAQEMMQLAEAGIPAWEMLAQKIGTSIPVAMKKAEQGGISANVGISAIIEGMTARFGGMMAKQSTTLLGLWSTFKDNLSKILRIIGLELKDKLDLGKIMTKFGDWLSKNEKKIKGWGSRIAKAVKDAYDGFLKFLSALTKKEVKDFADVIDTLVKALESLGAWFKKYGGTIGKVLREIGAFIGLNRGFMYPETRSERRKGALGTKAEEEIQAVAIEHEKALKAKGRAFGGVTPEEAKAGAGQAGYEEVPPEEKFQPRWIGLRDVWRDFAIRAASMQVAKPPLLRQTAEKPDEVIARELPKQTDLMANIEKRMETEVYPRLKALEEVGKQQNNMWRNVIGQAAQ